jgi:hypothetical protein
MEHLTRDQLEAGLDEIRRSPADDGSIALIVSRPAVDERVILAEAMLDTTVGLVGDTWRERGSSSTDDGAAHPLAQLTLMNVRAATLIAAGDDRRPLAGDQLYIDLDLGPANLPPGTRLALGDAVIEVTDKPHTGCKKFAERFGHEAVRFVNSPAGRELNLRGVNTRVVVGGTVRIGDSIRKSPAPPS